MIWYQQEFIPFGIKSDRKLKLKYKIGSIQQDSESCILFNNNFN